MSYSDDEFHPILQFLYESLLHKGVQLTDSYMAKLQKEIDDIEAEEEDEKEFDPDYPRF